MTSNARFVNLLRAALGFKPLPTENHHLPVLWWDSWWKGPAPALSNRRRSCP